MRVSALELILLQALLLAQKEEEPLLHEEYLMFAALVAYSNTQSMFSMRGATEYKKLKFTKISKQRLCYHRLNLENQKDERDTNLTHLRVFGCNTSERGRMFVYSLVQHRLSLNHRRLDHCHSKDLLIIVTGETHHLANENTFR